MCPGDVGPVVYRASDELANDEWLATLRESAERLDLDDDAVATATDLFLDSVPDADRSKPPALAASLYAGALVAGDGRSQADVADAVGVSRLAVQDRWKDRLRDAGLEPPEW